MSESRRKIVPVILAQSSRKMSLEHRVRDRIRPCFKIPPSETFLDTPLACEGSASGLGRSAKSLDLLPLVLALVSFCCSLNGKPRGGRGKGSPVPSSSPGEVKYKSNGDPDPITPYLFWLVRRGLVYYGHHNTMARDHY
jgi:hypothetical protein